MRRILFPDFWIGKIRAVMPIYRRSFVFAVLRIFIIILPMILSIIVSSALCDKEYDQRAEQKDTDSERSDREQNAGGDNAVFGVGETNIDVIRTNSCRCRSRSSVNLSFTAYIGSYARGLSVILIFLGKSVSCSLRQTFNLYILTVLQIIMYSSTAVFIGCNSRCICLSCIIVSVKSKYLSFEP